MAGEWIKMRTNLLTDARVARVARETGVTKPAVCGAFFYVWAIADEHGTEGELPGLTADVLDAEVGVPGFTAAAVLIDWLEEHSDGTLTVPRFEEHNSRTAKRRASETKRKQKSRETSNEKKPERQPPKRTGSPPRVATDPASTDWEPIVTRLSKHGVTAARSAVRFCRATGWSAALANAVIDHFERHPKAWEPFQLYERFRAPVLEVADGWPPPKVNEGQKRLDALEAESAATRARQASRRAVGDLVKTLKVDSDRLLNGRKARA